jgi:hypothetical protein
MKVFLFVVGFALASVASASTDSVSIRTCADVHGNEIRYYKSHGRNKFTFSIFSRHSVRASAAAYIHKHVRHIANHESNFNPEYHTGYLYGAEPGRLIVFPYATRRWSQESEAVLFYDRYRREDAQLFFVEKEHSIEFVWHMQTTSDSKSEQWTTWTFDQCE